MPDIIHSLVSPLHELHNTLACEHTPWPERVTTKDFVMVVMLLLLVASSQSADAGPVASCSHSRMLAKPAASFVSCRICNGKLIVLRSFITVNSVRVTVGVTAA